MTKNELKSLIYECINEIALTNQKCFIFKNHIFNLELETMASSREKAISNFIYQIKEKVYNHDKRYLKLILAEIKKKYILDKNTKILEKEIQA